MRFLVSLLVLLGMANLAAAQQNPPRDWVREFPLTDFSQTSIAFNEILSGGPPRDGIPAIDDPQFVSVEVAARRYDAQEPVIGVILNGEAKAYPLQILMWHEIVNDSFGGHPVAVTFCPLCNASVVFDAMVNGQALDFGTTGKLRNSDLVMYDRQTETWWQQFTGEALIGEQLGTQLTALPARVESFENFAARAPEGQVLVPNNDNFRRYGQNPYVAYDSRNGPYGFYNGPLPEGIDPMARVVVVDETAWALSLIRDAGRFEAGELSFSWEAGQNSALDSSEISRGQDVGNVIVQRDGADVPYDVAFAFAYHAFFPEKEIITTLN